ncbi:hypothetical protein OC835_007509 [Tilletia horrida]|nr:hypothetical protein OC835_007509 [Tilletia horrida]
MTRRADPLPPALGTSHNPITLSSQSSASQASTHEREGVDSAVLRKLPYRWSVDKEVAFVKFVKDNIHYQNLLLPGHLLNPDGKLRVDSTGKLSAASVMRAASNEIFPEDEQKTVEQMKQKWRGIDKIYRRELVTQTKTGQGLLLSEISTGPMRTLRERIIERVPWWEIYHEMARDRQTSDPDILVTGAGEQHLRALDEDSDDPDAQASGVGSTGASGSHAAIPVHDSSDTDDGRVLSQLSEYSRRQQEAARTRQRHEQRDLDDDDFDSVDSGSPTRIPRASRSVSSSQKTSSSSASQRSAIVIPRRDALPSLPQLSSQSSTDAMRAGAVRARTTRLDTATPSVKQENDASSSSARRCDESSLGKRKAKGKGRSSAVDAAVEEFARSLEDDRDVQIERELTKRQRLEVRASEIAMRAKERERQADALHSRLGSIDARLEGQQTRLEHQLTLLTTINARVEAIFHRAQE